MWPDRVSNSGPLALESDALRGLAKKVIVSNYAIKHCRKDSEKEFYQ